MNTRQNNEAKHTNGGTTYSLLRYETNPNQRIVTMQIELEQPYGSISRKAERIAVRLLDDRTAAYILYVHLALNQNEYEEAFSPAAIEAELGISGDRCRKAFKQLVDKGYLVATHENSNRYIFYQIPPQYANKSMAVDEDIVIERNRVSLPTSIGYPYGQGEGICTGEDRNITTITDKINRTMPITQKDTFYIDDTPETDTFVFGDNNGKVSTLTAKNIFNGEYERRKEKAIWDNGTLDGIRITSILKKYLSQHPETPIMKRWGDKYGRYIKGWNEGRQEPIVVYAPMFIPFEMMKHNIADVPKEYCSKESTPKE